MTYTPVADMDLERRYSVEEFLGMHDGATLIRADQINSMDTASAYVYLPKLGSSGTLAYVRFNQPMNASSIAFRSFTRALPEADTPILAPSLYDDVLKNMRRMLTGPFHNILTATGYDNFLLADSDDCVVDAEVVTTPYPGTFAAVMSEYLGAEGNDRLHVTYRYSDEPDFFMNLSGEDILKGLARGEMIVASNHDMEGHMLAYGLLGSSQVLSRYVKQVAQRELDDTAHDWARLPDMPEHPAVRVLTGWDFFTGVFNNNMRSVDVVSDGDDIETAMRSLLTCERGLQRYLRATLPLGPELRGKRELLSFRELDEYTVNEMTEDIVSSVVRLDAHAQQYLADLSLT